MDSKNQLMFFLDHQECFASILLQDQRSVSRETNKVSFEILMTSEKNIRKFQYEGPSQIKCEKDGKRLSCSWIQEKELWNLAKIDFCFNAFVRDTRFLPKPLIRKSSWTMTHGY